VVTGYFADLITGTDKIEQMAVTARMDAIWVLIVDTGQGVLED
jgi:hypothetical protein